MLGVAGSPRAGPAPHIRWSGPGPRRATPYAGYCLRLDRSRTRAPQPAAANIASRPADAPGHEDAPVAPPPVLGRARGTYGLGLGRGVGSAVGVADAAAPEPVWTPSVGVAAAGGVGVAVARPLPWDTDPVLLLTATVGVLVGTAVAMDMTVAVAVTVRR